MVVDLTIGDDSVFVVGCEYTERLLSFRRKIVNGQSVEANDARSIQMKNGMVRTSWPDLLKAL